MSVGELAWLLAPLVHVFSIKDLSHVRRNDFDEGVRQRLAEALVRVDLIGDETCCVALAVEDCMGKLVGLVEAVGNEFIRSLPFIRVVVKAVEMVDNDVTLFELIAAKLRVAEEFHWGCNRRRCLEAESLVYHVGKMVQLRNGAETHFLVQLGQVRASLSTRSIHVAVNN